MSKGSNARPMQVNRDEYRRRFEATFSGRKTRGADRRDERGASPTLPDFGPINKTALLPAARGL